MAHRLGPGRIVHLLIATTALSCSNGGSSSQTVDGQVISAGRMVDDPARNRVYVVDAGKQRLVAFDSASSAALVSVTFDAAPEGVARDDDGDRVFVSLPSQRRVEVLDAATLAPQKEFALNAAMHDLSWRDAGRLVVATDAGLVLIDVDKLTGRTVMADAGADARLVHDAKHQRVWCAFTRGSDLVVATVDPDVLGDVPVENVIGTNFDVPIGVALSFDESQLLVGSAFSSALFVVDAATLALQQTVPMLPKFTSMTVNKTGTRLYASPGDDSAQEVPLDTYTGGATLSADAEIEPGGALVDATGASLVVHLSSSVIDTVPPFEDRLIGKPLIVTGTPYEVTLSGTPSEPFTLMAGTLPGFFDYGPPTPPRTFLDIDISTFHVLLVAALDASGKFKFSTTVAASSGLAGTTFLLQAVVLDPDTGQPGAPTNVMVMRIVNP